MKRISTLFLCCAFSFACGDDDKTEKDAGVTDTGHHELDLNEMAEHVCTHFQVGTPHTATASTAKASAPSLEVGHEVTTVTLVPFEGDRGGYLNVMPDEETHIVFFLTKAIPVSLTDANNAVVSAHKEEGQPATCAAIKKILVYELSAATYGVKLGPTTETEVDLLAEEGHEH